MLILGFFRNTYDGSVAIQETTGRDTDPASGNTATVEFDNAFKVFSATSGTTLTVG